MTSAEILKFVKDELECETGLFDLILALFGKYSEESSLKECQEILECMEELV